jgi:catalase
MKNKYQNNSPAGLPISVRLAAIIILVMAASCAFAYAAGWLTPARLTPTKMVDSLAPAGGPIKGYRRNHAKGICFAGSFEANGEAVAISRAPLFKVGTYPVTGRFNLAGPIPSMADGTGRVRGLSLRIQAADGQEWRTAMINAPLFPVATPSDFYALQRATANKQDPAAAKQFAASHPALRAFGAWASTAPYAESYAEDRFNSLNSFVFTNAQGRAQAVRWSFIPTAAAVPVPPEELKKRDPDFLFKEITERTAAAPQKWRLVMTLANPGDPTADPTQVWPEDRPQIDAGMLVVTQIVPEADGACRDINFDPTVLPEGIRTSDDPFPAARSAAYAVSYDRRTAESEHYPRTQTGGKP